jgi:hypothetical protein
MAKKLCVSGTEMSRTGGDRYRYMAQAHSNRTDEHPNQSAASFEFLSDENLMIGQAVTITVEVA